MKLRPTIAIQGDFVRQPGGQEQSFSQRWNELAADRGIDVREVDVFKSGAVEAIRGSDGFMWRYGYGETDLAFAKRLLPAIEHGLQIPVFPKWNTSWHFEDKIAQCYLLEAADIDAPRTWIFWTENEALEFCRTADYPLVAKLAAGIRSANVMLLRTRRDAERLVRRMFESGVHTFSPGKLTLRRLVGGNRFVRQLRGRPVEYERRHSGYFYAQEFLPDNAFDTRVTVIGNRAFAFRRFNRQGDFRASGSGNISWDPREIDLPTVRLAFEVAAKLGTQSVAVDGMRRGDTRLIAEISYTYAAWAIEKCPGHWTQSPSGELRWVDGQLRAEDAIFADFADQLQGKVRSGSIFA